MTHPAARSSTEPVVRAEGLGRRFGSNWALAHLDLRIAAGECVAIAGANGSGKTTLLRLVAGLLRPTTGVVWLFGADPVAGRLAARARTSLVSHDSYLYPRLSAREMVQVWASLLGYPQPRDAATAALEQVGLKTSAEAHVGGFSAGMKKRLQLARLELEAADLVLLDEPLAALDPPGQQLIEQTVRRLTAAGRTVLLASHQLERAAALAGRALILRGGQLAWQGSGSELTTAATRYL